MNKIKILFSIIVLNSLVVKAQNTSVTVKPYGYVSYEVIFDSYKSIDSRDGELYFYPVKRVLDKAGNDINSRPYLQFVSLQSRFGFNVSGPELGTAKTTAQIEGDFYGTSDSYVNLLRLRLAFLKISWSKTELLLGQNFHPTIIAECVPAPLSFGSGVPYHTLNRSVQARFIFKPVDKIKILLAAVMVSTHKSVGPADAQRRSGIPEFQAQIQFGSANKFLCGFTGGQKFLMPMDTTRLGYKTTNRVGSYNLQAFALLNLNKISFKYQVSYGTNLTNFTMIGGYGVKAGSENPVTGELEFTNMKTISTWMDIETKNQTINFGVYSGYSQNLGGENNLDITGIYKPLFYNRNADINYIFRIAPRIFMKRNNILTGVEWGLNGAAYGTQFNSKRKATKTDDLVYNNRVLLLVKYNF